MPSGAQKDPGKPSLISNALYNFFAFGLTAATTFVMTPVLINALGKEQYGLWSLIDSILIFLALADLGVGSAVLRFFGRYHAVDDREKLNQVFSTSLVVLTVGGMAAVATSVVAAVFVSDWFRIDEHLHVHASVTILILGANVAIGLPLGVYQTITASLQRYRARSLIQIVFLVIQAITFYVIAASGGNLIHIAIAITCLSLVRGLVLVIYTHLQVPFLRFSFRAINKSTFREIASYSGYVLVSVIAGRIAFNLDAMVIGSFLDTALIAFYAVGLRMVNFSKDALAMLMSVVGPRVTQLDALGATSEIRDLFLISCRLALYFSIFIQAWLFFFSCQFFGLWLGESFAEASTAISWIFASILPLTTCHFLGMRILHGTGYVKFICYASILNGIGNLLLSLLLVRDYGINGVALGTVIPHVLFSVAVLVVSCSLIRLPFFSWVRLATVRPLVAGTLLWGLWSLSSFMTVTETWANLVLQSALGLVLFGILVAILDTDVRNAIASKVARPGFLAKSGDQII